MVFKSAILSHKKTQDGVRAWTEMVSKYENGGDRETRLNTLEAIIDTPFHGRYKGGLLQWITDYENAFAELAELGCANWDDESRKRRILKNVSEENGLDKFVFKELTKDMDYKGVLGKLRSFNVQSSKTAENKAYKSARFGSSGGAFFLGTLIMTKWPNTFLRP